MLVRFWPLEEFRNSFYYKTGLTVKCGPKTHSEKSKAFISYHMLCLEQGIADNILSLQ